MLFNSFIFLHHLTYLSIKQVTDYSQGLCVAGIALVVWKITMYMLQVKSQLDNDIFVLSCGTPVNLPADKPKLFHLDGFQGKTIKVLGIFTPSGIENPQECEVTLNEGFNQMKIKPSNELDFWFKRNEDLLLIKLNWNKIKNICQV